MSDIPSKTSVQYWRDRCVQFLRNETTRAGEFPHRLGQIGHAMSEKSLNDVFDLAEKGRIAMSGASKKKQDRLVADRLRGLADEIDQAEE